MKPPKLLPFSPGDRVRSIDKHAHLGLTGTVTVVDNLSVEQEVCVRFDCGVASWFYHFELVGESIVERMARLA